MKKILVLLCLLSFLFVSLGTEGSAVGGALGFYIPRAGKKRPELPKEEAIIEKHGGYYIDRRVTDESERRVLYLTFDAGYDNGNVGKVLDALAAEKVKAAFFVLDHLILEIPISCAGCKKKGILSATIRKIIRT